MKIWWVLGVLLLLLFVVVGIRESFNNYEEALKDVGQTAGYTSLTPKCPEGSSLNATSTMCKFTDASKADVVPTCSSDTLEFVGGACRPKQTNTAVTTQTATTTPGASKSSTTTTPGSSATISASQSSTTTTPGTAATTSASQSSTGGSSTSSYGPNSGGSTGKGRTVFGPTFTGIGDGANVPSTDTSKTNQYPELLGGGGGNKPSTRMEGVGITMPSKNWQLTMDGSLPSSASLGTDENSKYLPFSRQPGDMELIPDPYRVSQQFSSSSYSFKTEPAPYLTDFSAFQR